MKDIQKIKEFFSKPLEESTTEYFKPSIRKDKSNPNFLYIDIAYPAGSDVLSVGGSKTMGGQDREAGAAKALSMGNNIAKKLQAKYNIEDIDVSDLKNGKVEVFAVSDDFTKMSTPSLDESLTAGYPYRKTSGEGFEKIVIAEPMDDATRERMIRRFEAEGWDAKPNFGGGITAVKKTLMNEANGFTSGKQMINIKLKNYPKAVAKVNQLIDMIGESNFTMEMAEWIWDFFNNASFEQPVNEAKSISDYKVGDVISFKDGEDWKVMKVKDNVGKLVIKPHNEKAKKGNVSLEIDIDADYLKKNLSESKSEDKVDTITMDIPLFLRMLEYSREDAEQDLDLHDVTEKANTLGKEKGILSMEDYDAIVGAAEDTVDEGRQVHPVVMQSMIKNASKKLKSSKLSSAEYQEVKKLKDFKASDWKYDSKEDLYTKVTEVSDYMKRRLAQDDYTVSKKDKPKKSYNPTPSGKTDYMKRREKDLAEAILAKLKK